ncbi:hypothetical protein [Xanthomonas translucens]|uniref:hypothetical protein n=2 Tax=Xanthomonas campestris pv. translucens TaxID=343 RepID=UPI001112150E|nr:hypothetical protein [Xanthomonas translucens]QEO26662.1 hypothetical protein F0H32_11055 [Xanthomonas translucens pv. undulosa]QSQ54232.1 hypothetical protein ISN36_08630 [Xanthomonas translucens pv. undulosa]QSQ60150.1 hypothetical protein ISN38_19125 [Xanthomonas translucens pv. undulosa]WLA06986.1 hypothetical protein MO328_10980 [Xanthomonas translucens]
MPDARHIFTLCQAMPIRFLLSLLLLSASAALAAQTLPLAYPEGVRRFSTHHCGSAPSMAAPALCRPTRDSDACRSNALRLIAQWPDQLPIRAL